VPENLSGEMTATTVFKGLGFDITCKEAKFTLGK
jgi:hypothetical protein